MKYRPHPLRTPLLQLCRLISLPLLILSASCGQARDLAAATSGPAGKLAYDVHFVAQFRNDSNTARIRIEVAQTHAQLRHLDFNAPQPRYRFIEADGAVEQTGQRIRWAVPERGGAITMVVQVDHQRDDAFDARHTPSWVIMRLGDLFPRARARTLKGAQSNATLSLLGPLGWSFETPYGNVDAEPHTVPSRRGFNHPVGWLVGGELGTRRTTIGEHHITVSAPRGSGFRRLDVLSFLRLTWPTVTAVYPTLPQRILIVGAPAPMWRGALSAPDSLYLHTDRPLVSENATSSLLHELGHLAGFTSAAPGDDWIAEGLTEFYSIEILRRSGAISEARAERTFKRLADWAATERGRLTDPSKGADTAAAVIHFRHLQDELPAGSLEEIVAQLLANPPISSAILDTVVQQARKRPH